MNTYQKRLPMIHNHVIENYGTLPYYTKLFSLLDFDIIPKYRSNKGRRGYSNHTMIKLALIGMIEKLNTYGDHRRFLIDRPHLCDLIGLRYKHDRYDLPSDATFSTFFNSADSASLIKDLFSHLMKQLLPILLHHYRYLCVDSQPVLDASSHNNPKHFSKAKSTRDPIATWGVKGKSNAPSKNSEKRDMLFFHGYKIHMLSLGPFPLVYNLTPANKADSPEFIGLLQKVMDEFGLFSLDVCADKAYDSRENFNFTQDVFKGWAYIPKRRKASFVTPRGKCTSLLKHHSTYREKKRDIVQAKFCCPLFTWKKRSVACPFKNDLFISNYGCTSYTSLSNGNARNWIDSSSPEFKKVYRFRLNVENLFSIAEDGRLHKINGWSMQYLDTKVSLFNLFIALSASLALSIGREDFLLSTVRLKDLFVA